MIIIKFALINPLNKTNEWMSKYLNSLVIIQQNNDYWESKNSGGFRNSEHQKS